MVTPGSFRLARFAQGCCARADADTENRAEENVRKRMSTEQFIEFFGMKTKPDPKIALPVVTFTSEVTFHVKRGEKSKKVFLAT